jgi:hypothetical protein
MASINLSVVYSEVQKIATNRGEPSKARSRIDLFHKDVATSRLEPGERVEHVGRLRDILVTAGQQHPGAAHGVFQEAVDALTAEAELRNVEAEKLSR